MNCTPATLKFYSNTAGVFLKWCEGQSITQPQEVTARIVRQYLAGLEGKADRTRHAHARAIKTLLRFWHAEKYIPETVKFEMPKIAKRRLPRLTAEQLQAVLKVCNVRDRAIVLFMADSGLRRSEVIALNVSDVDMQSGSVAVARGKGRKANTRRVVYLACVERARRDGREVWRATAREVAELANIGAKRAAEGLQDLAEYKLIKRVNSGKDAGLYRFLRLSEMTTVYTTGSCSVVSWDAPKTQAEQDVFGKLGIVSWYVWKYILDTPAKSGSEIAKATGLPYSSVYTALYRLQDDNVRLATRAGDGFVYGEPRTDASLQSLALSWSSNGESKSAIRKTAHRIERERMVNKVTRRYIEYFENTANEHNAHTSNENMR